MTNKEKENLKKLLLSDDELNIRVGIQILQNVEPDAVLWAVILYLLITHPKEAEVFTSLWEFTSSRVVMNPEPPTHPLANYFMHYSIVAADTLAALEVFREHFPVDLQVCLSLFINQLGATSDTDLIQYVLFCQEHDLDISEIGALHQKSNLDIRIAQKLPTHTLQSLTAFPNLEEVSISQKVLLEFPEDLSACKQLQSVRIFEQPWEVFPVGLLSNPNISQIDFYHVPLQNIDDNIRKLSNLGHLNIYNSQITHIPESIQALQKLHRLQIYQAQISRLPETLGFCKSLTYLNLNHIENLVKL